MSTILTETEGFTPVIDVLAEELGLMTAVVYGIVWRYCQMENKVCSASRETIAKHANISIKTVDRHLAKLCEAGYLRDLHPEWKHRPHIYADTGKLKIEALVKVRRGETESPTSEGRTESPTTETQSPTGGTESLTGETESPTKILSYDSSYDSQSGEEKSAFPETPAPVPVVFKVEQGHPHPIAPDEVDQAAFEAEANPEPPSPADAPAFGEEMKRKEHSDDDRSGESSRGSSAARGDSEAQSAATADHRDPLGTVRDEADGRNVAAPSSDGGHDHGPAEGLDPLMMPLARATASARAQGGNYADPDDGILVAEAIACLCGGKPPRRGSGTWRDMANTIEPIHADWGLHDKEVGEALAIIKAAIALFLEEKQQMAVYKYPSFAANYGHYLCRVMNGDTQKPARTDPDRFDRATAMTRERLRQHGHR